MVKRLLTEIEKEVLTDFVEYYLDATDKGKDFTNFSPAYKKINKVSDKQIADIFSKRNRNAIVSEPQTLGGEGELVFLKHFNLSLSDYFERFNNSLHDEGKGGGDGGIDFEINGLRFDIKTTKNTFNGFCLKYFNKKNCKKLCDYFVFIRYDTDTRIHTILGYASWESVLSALYYNEQRKCWFLDTEPLYNKGLLNTNINTISH
jgi:hypothetical protein